MTIIETTGWVAAENRAILPEGLVDCDPTVALAPDLFSQVSSVPMPETNSQIESAKSRGIGG